MKLNRLVLTGAAGRLGSHLREPLTKLADTLVSSDIVEDFGRTHPNEEYVRADLADLDAMVALMEGADTVVHFGAIGDEAPFETLLGPNFIGAYNVWEAAHRQGVRRVVYASSIHAVGMHSKHDFIGTDAAHRPDTYYGLAKCFAEDIASMYWDKRGLESVCMRIASCAQVNERARAGDVVVLRRPDPAGHARDRHADGTVHDRVRRVEQRSRGARQRGRQPPRLPTGGQRRSVRRGGPGRDARAGPDRPRPHAPRRGRSRRWSSAAAGWRR